MDGTGPFGCPRMSFTIWMAPKGFGFPRLRGRAMAFGEFGDLAKFRVHK